MSNDVEEDPGIQINFSNENSIDNCLSLAALTSVGPANSVVLLQKGKKKVLVEVNLLLAVDLLL